MGEIKNKAKDIVSDLKIDIDISHKKMKRDWYGRRWNFLGELFREVIIN